MADGPFGPACDAVPADGEGSFAGMTDDTAANRSVEQPAAVDARQRRVGGGSGRHAEQRRSVHDLRPHERRVRRRSRPTTSTRCWRDQELLTSILTYHVVAGESLDAAALGEAGSAATVNGAELEFGADGTTVNGVDVAVLERDDRQRHGPHHR